MLDYAKVKDFYTEKLIADREGRGRIESAAYHTIRYVYLKGVEDGLAAAGVPDDERKRIVALIG